MKRSPSRLEVVADVRGWHLLVATVATTLAVVIQVIARF